ncbi:MAG: heparin lyase I family protein, partial [Fibrobacteres bacterium]|nr:heparin lyase I family protein [Fibrobacterota bacterium]
MFKWHVNLFYICIISNSLLCADDTTFYGDWESGSVVGVGNHNWGVSEVVSPDRFKVIRDNSARQGSYYARVEVRSGDDPFNDGGTERAEVSQPNGVGGEWWEEQIFENMQSGTQIYSFSVKFDSSWKNITNIAHTGAWGIFLQLHGPGGGSPVFALSATDKIRLNRQTTVNNAVPNIEYDLADGTILKGKWIDFVLTVRFDTAAAGFIKVERRNEGTANFAVVLDLKNVITLQNGEQHYIKHGLYRNPQ